MNRLPEIIAELPVAVRAALMAGAQLVVQSAQNRVPFDPQQPHHIRDALHIELDAEGVMVVAGDKDVFWAHMIEHGTVHSSPHPFLVPALEENVVAIEALANEAIRRIVE